MIDIDEVWAEIEGVSIEEYKKNKKIDDEINNKSIEFENLPPQKWPKLYFNWDLAISAQRYALDGETALDFKINYPNGFIAYSAILEEVDAYLHEYNKRQKHEIWSVGFKSKLSKVIAYLSIDDRLITPPLSKILNNKIYLIGGNHRYTAAKFSGQKEIVMYTTIQNAKFLNEHLSSIEWID